eukprot:gene8164-5693_t
MYITSQHYQHHQQKSITSEEKPIEERNILYFYSDRITTELHPSWPLKTYHFHFFTFQEKERHPTYFCRFCPLQGAHRFGFFHFSSPPFCFPFSRSRRY